MADHSSNDMTEHTKTYEGFLVGSIVLALVTAFVMVALVSFRFAHTLNVFTGFAGLIIGILATLINARMGGKSWWLSVAVLVLFGIITAINVS
jgi:Bacterial aa3 type cytochrome c oxidase subunit IV